MEYKNETLKKIWNLFYGEDKPTEAKAEEVVTEEVETAETEAVESKFLDATLEDGTLVQIEPALEVGAAVIVIDAEGNPMQAPDAVHVLADGTQVTTVEGLITEIVPVEEEVEEVEEEMEVDTTEAEAREAKKVVESIIKESHFSKEEVNEIVNNLKEEFEAKINEIKKSTVEAFEAFGKTEEREPTEKRNFSFQQKNKSKNIFHRK